MTLRWWEGLGVFGLALGVRLYGIAEAPLWGDEIFSWAAARLSPGRIVPYLLEGNNTPLWELLLHGWMLLWGDEAAALRSLAAIWSAGAAVGLYVLGCQTGGRWAGAIAALTWIFSTFGQSVGREARAYALLAFLTTVSHIAFLRWLLRRQGLLLWVFSLVLLFYTHYMGIWVGLWQLVSLFWVRPGDFRMPSFWAAFGGAAVGALGPLVVFAERLWHYPSTPLGASASLEGLYNALWAFSNQPVPTVAALVVLGGGFVWWAYRGSLGLAVRYGYGAFGFLYLLLWGMGLVAPIWLPRYLMPAAMGYYWALGLSVAAFPSRVRWGIAAGLMLLWVGSWEPLPMGQGKDYPAIVQRLLQKPPQQPLVVSPSWHTLTWSYYLLRPIHEPSDWSRLPDLLAYRYRMFGAGHYAELPTCLIEATDTLWWLEMGYCQAYPHGILPELLGTRFTPVAVERLGAQAALWLWVATESLSSDTKSLPLRDSSYAGSHSGKALPQNLPQKSTR